ncbi:hypothetical protein [Eisenibacter elegans]|uniref:hypothetical protein n=1 Tax=Eisenibacter elegans TaxID=997 RepID=UPI00040172E7|nr:hypothetical protein [Eisenibacter elegans]
MFFEQDDNLITITGRYNHEDGLIVGTIHGNVVSSRWIQSSNDRSGLFEFTIATDGQSFQGSWCYGTDVNRRDWYNGWDARRVK